MRKNVIKRTVAAALCAAVFAVRVPYAAAESDITLKVGYIGYEGFMNPDEKGRMNGYGVEYLDDIGSIAGIDYEYIPCTWTDSLEMLKNHEIDLVCTSKYSEERAEIYDYSAESFGNVQGVLYTRADNSDIYYEDFGALNGKTIAFLNSSMNIFLFADYAEEKGFEYNSRFYASDTEMEQALLCGDVDAIATENNVDHNSLKLIGVYSSDDYYLMSYKGNTFMDDIDRAMSEISSADSYYTSALFDKYFNGRQKTLSLTRQEADYVSSCGIITVGMLPNRFPMSSVDENSSISGITRDFFEEISRISGLRFYYVPVGESKKPVEELKNGKFDIAAGVIISEPFKDDKDIIISEPYYNTTAALVGRSGTAPEDFGSVTVVCKTASEEMPHMAEKLFENCEIIREVSDEKCLDAVKSGQADYFIQNINVVSYLLQQPKYQSLEIVPTFFEDESNGAVFRKNTNPYLISVFNKAVRCISDQKTTEITIKNTSAAAYKLTFSDVIYKYYIQIIIAAAAVAAAIALLTGLNSRQKRCYADIIKKNADLERALAQAENADKSKTKLLEKIGYDVRTPINVISGVADAAVKHLDDPARTADYFDKIKFCTGALMDILDDISIVNETEKNSSAENNASFDINEAVSKISEENSPRCSEADCELSCSSDIRFGRLIGSRDGLKKTVSEMISAVLKCGAKGKITISFSEAQRNEDRIFIKAEMIFSDCGAAPDITAAEKDIGAVQGALSVSRDNGNISVRAFIPFDIDMNFIGSEKIFNDDRRMAALIIDEDPNSRKFTQMVLENVGVESDCTDNGDDAAKLAALKDYSVCFINMNLGDKVTEAAGKIKSVCQWTAVAALGEDDADIPSGCDMYARKSRFNSEVFRIMTRVSETERKRHIPVCAADSYDFKGRKVIIADADEINAEITAELIGMTGAETEIAVNGDAAVRMFEMSEKGEYDAVLLPLQMPVSDGFEACRRIRSSMHPDGKTIPIFALSAHSLPSDVSRSLAAGMNGHFSKPVNTVMLYKALKAAFDGAESSAVTD